MEIILTDVRRRWRLFRRRRFVLQVPERWEDVPDSRRRRWWRIVATMPPEQARRNILDDLIPRRWQRKMNELELAMVAERLAFATVSQDCTVVPVTEFSHREEIYVFPHPKGPNVSGVEFALCDDYFAAFMAGDPQALLHISACIWREENTDAADSLRRGDRRRPLHNKFEVEERAKRLLDAPAEMHVQAFNWFVGLKKYVHRVYGPWIFEADEDEEDDAEETAHPKPADKKPSRGPNFGWWGIFIDIADAGAYGIKPQVYQESIHDICIYLVKKRADANQAPEPKKEEPEDED